MEPSEQQLSLNKPKKEFSKKAVIAFEPSQVISIANFDAVSETEIAAEISLPEEGGWGWVVVAASFMCIFILDGIFFTFGSIFNDISEDLETNVSLVAAVNSIAIALYFITGPIVSALINRFGFRSCTMTGSIIVSISYFVSYFASNYAVLLIFYGVAAGFGGCFILMSSQLIVGFYFERLRALAMAIAGLGQSLGIMIMSTVNTYLIQLGGWRTTTLIHSGLFGIIYFIGMAYRPLLSITVTQTADDTCTTTYLPSLSIMSMKRTGSVHKDLLNIEPSVAERLFSAPSNTNFPTAAAVLEESEIEDSDDDSLPGPSSGPAPGYIVTSRSPLGGIHQEHLRTNQKEKQIEVTLTHSSAVPTTKKWWQKCFHWRKHIDKSRPMYRDDAFYNGTIENLPVYKNGRRETQSVLAGLEYRMAVSRTVTTLDLNEPKGIYSTAVRRILATMMNPKLLGRRSFLMVCCTGFLIHVGLLVPLIFLADRNKGQGIDLKHCNMFVSVIGFSSAIGRLMAGLLAYKFHKPLKFYTIACLSAGSAVILSNFSFNLFYQYGCCVIFGISSAHISTLRSLVIVDLYGLDNLTNATGMLLMFQGLGSLLSTPLSSLLKTYFGYVVSFCVAGTFIVVGALLLVCVKRVFEEEAKEKIKTYLITRRRSSVRRNEKNRNDNDNDDDDKDEK